MKAQKNLDGKSADGQGNTITKPVYSNLNYQATLTLWRRTKFVMDPLTRQKLNLLVLLLHLPYVVSNSSPYSKRMKAVGDAIWTITIFQLLEIVRLDKKFMSR